MERSKNDKFHTQCSLILRCGLLINTCVTSSPVLRSLWSRLFRWLPSWKPTSETLLEQAEREVLKGELTDHSAQLPDRQSTPVAVTSDHKDLYVPIARSAVVRTYVAEPTEDVVDAPRFPLVMIHGFGAGFLQFYKNLDYLHTQRRLAALDIPGFGRSTRISFTSDAEKAEEEMVDHLETWRRVMGLERFVLLGHSLGAFLACSYSIRHPSRVQHLILVDPWGISPAPSEEEIKKRFPFLAKRFWQMVGRMKPFDPVRMAGPWGKYPCKGAICGHMNSKLILLRISLGSDVIHRTRPDLSRNFGVTFMNYVYHCNVQKPTLVSTSSALCRISQECVCVHA